MESKVIWCRMVGEDCQATLIRPVADLGWTKYVLSSYAETVLKNAKLDVQKVFSGGNASFKTYVEPEQDPEYMAQVEAELAVRLSRA